MVTKFQEQVEPRSYLVNSSSRIYDLFLKPPFGRVRLADCLEKAVRWLWVDQVEHRKVDTKLEGL
jgi:hypothetical protein